MLQTRGRHRQANNMVPLKLNIIESSPPPRTGLAELSVGACQNVGQFSENSVACGNLSLPAPYSRLFQWRLSAPYGLVPGAVGRVDSPLVRPCVNAINYTASTAVFVNLFCELQPHVWAITYGYLQTVRTKLQNEYTNVRWYKFENNKQSSSTDVTGVKF